MKRLASSYNAEAHMRPALEQLFLSEQLTNVVEKIVPTFSLYASSERASFCFSYSGGIRPKLNHTGFHTILQLI